MPNINIFLLRFTAQHIGFSFIMFYYFGRVNAFYTSKIYVKVIMLSKQSSIFVIVLV